MSPEAAIETKLPVDSEAHSNEDGVFVRTVRLTLNLTTHILIVLTVFVCLLYAWKPELNAFQLHIVLCVLGYQFFMSQGTLVLSKYNSWSMSLPRRYRRHLHWFLQVIGILLVTAGSCVIMKAKTPHNFNTCHGVLGLCALLTALLGFINGLLAMNAYKLRSYLDIFWIKHIHYVTGISTMFFSAVSLCLGFNQAAFKSWSGSQDAIVLIVFTALFTILVASEFWILMGRRICSFMLT